MLDQLSLVARKPVTHLLTAIGFIIFNLIGLKYLGGLSFVQGWGGGMAAVIATAFLVFKSKGYWTWMIINAGLWTYLFFHTGLPMLAWLQVSIMIFSIYGLAQWIMVRFRIGFSPRVRSDLFGSVLALAVFIYSVYAYRDMPGYTGTQWWWLEFGSVITAIAAMWMDAFKYKVNWVMWTLSNCCSAPLFFHIARHNSSYWGVFYTIFIYQTLNCIGFYHWIKDEKRLVAEGKVERVGLAEVF